jgi:hypothetical protein
MTNQLHAEVDFERARRRAFLRDAFAVLARRPNDLIPFRELRARLRPAGESYRGLQAVPVDRIVGSTDRSRDFDRAFFPRRRHAAARWTRIARAQARGEQLPPVQLYKLGDLYFVKDGHHRVSVARVRGQRFIDAEVSEGHVRIPLAATMSPQELLLQLEYAEFLRRTDLDRLRPEHDVRPTALGRYDELWQHIRLHQLALAEAEGRTVPTEEAVVRWYDEVYCPIASAARGRGVLERFPDRTETDVYLWVVRHRDALADRRGRDGGPEAAVDAYAAAHGRPGARLAARLRSMVPALPSSRRRVAPGVVRGCRAPLRERRQREVPVAGRTEGPSVPGPPQTAVSATRSAARHPGP